MDEKELTAIKDVVQKADDWNKDCHCGFKDGKPTWCEQYGCTTIDELVKPLRELLATKEIKQQEK